MKTASSSNIHLFRSLLGIDGNLLAHGSEDNDVGVLALISEELLDLVASFTIGDLNIVLGAAILRHEGEKAVVLDVKKLVFLTADIGDVHVVGGRAELFKLLAGEDVDGN